MSTVLVVDDMAIFREPIAAALRSANYETLSADNGMSVFSLIEAKRPDLILLDVSMPTMDGLSCLDALRMDVRYQNIPVVLLTAVADKECVVRAGNLGVKDYLVKASFSLETLFQCVRKYTTPNGELLRAAKAEQSSPGEERKNTTSSTTSVSPSERASRQAMGLRIRDMKGVKTLSGTVQKVLTLTNSANYSSDELVAVLAYDPIITSRILQVANSAAFIGPRGYTTNLAQAVLTLGQNTVHDIALSVGILETLPPRTSDGFDVVRCLEHCSAVASIMNQMIPNEDGDAQRRGRLIGLCHDLPELLIRNEFGKELEGLGFTPDSEVSFAERVEAVFDVSYDELVHSLLTKMTLPATFVNPIGEYFRQTRGDENQLQLFSRMTRMLHLANNIAHGLLLGPSAGCAVRSFTETDCRAAIGTYQPPAFLGKEFRLNIRSTMTALASLSPTDQGLLEQPLYPQLARRISFWRDETLSELDPVAFALEQMCELVLVDSLRTLLETATKSQGLILTLADATRLPAVTTQISQARAKRGGDIPPTLVFLQSGKIPTPLPEGISAIVGPTSLARLKTTIDQVFM